MSSLSFTERQQKTITAAITLLCGVFILGLLLWLGQLLSIFAARFSNVLLPLTVAGILALVFQPYYDLLLRVTKNKSVVAVIVLYVTVLVPVVAVLWFFGAVLVEQLSQLFEQLPELGSNVWVEAQTHLPFAVELWERFGGFVEEHTGAIAAGLQRFLSSTFSTGAAIVTTVTGLLGWVVFPIYLGFFLMAKPFSELRSENLLPFLKPETRKDVMYLVRQFVGMIVAFFRGQLLVALFQGLLFACGFALIGLKYGFVLGLMLGFMNIVPYLGSLLGLSIALPLAYFQPEGGAALLGGVLVVFTLVQCIEGYLLTPKIMGDKTGLHPMAIMVAVFFWSSALEGMLGLILAVPLTAFLVVFWRLAKEKYIQELV